MRSVGRRFGAAPLAPTTLGVAVGLVAHVLSMEYHEGRGKMTERGFEQARERRERRRREAANGWGEDPESAAGSRYGDGDGDETLANGNGTRDGNGTFVSAFDPARDVSLPAGRVTLWAMTAFAAAEGAGVAAATAVAGDAGLIFLPGDDRAAPRARRVGRRARASGRDAFDAAKGAARAAAAAPLGLVLTAAVGGMGPAASVVRRGGGGDAVVGGDESGGAGGDEMGPRTRQGRVRRGRGVGDGRARRRGGAVLDDALLR